MKAPIRPALAIAITLMAIPTLALAQAGPPQGPRPGGPPGPSADLLDLAIQSADSLALTSAQRASLDEFRTQSMERSASARELVEAERARVEAERAQADSAAGGPGARRGRRQGPRPEATPELREAMQTLAQERGAAMEELRSTLTVNQMDQLQRLARPALRGPGRVGPRTAARLRGRNGFGAGFRGRAGRFRAPRRPGFGGAPRGRAFPGVGTGRFRQRGAPADRGPTAFRTPGRFGDLAGGFGGGPVPGPAPRFGPAPGFGSGPPVAPQRRPGPPPRRGPAPDAGVQPGPVPPDSGSGSQ
jgi:hypothetical protein